MNSSKGFPWELVLIAVLIYIAAHCLYGCASSQLKTPPRSLCVIRPKDGRCWISKKTGKGFDLSAMDGFLALTQSDMMGITSKLNQCQDNPSPGAAEIRSSADQILSSGGSQSPGK